MPMDVPPPLPPAPPPTLERVITVVDNVIQRTGIFSKVAWRLVVTDQRLILALQAKNSINYLLQPPALTLQENPSNFEIPLSQLIKIETYQGDFESNSPDIIKIKTTGGTQQYNISDYYRVQKQLKGALGNLVS